MLKKIPYHEQLLSDMRYIEERIGEIKGLVLRWQALVSEERIRAYQKSVNIHKKDGRKKR